jgi:2-dehydro-3-deoxyphosphooctonate aldolase (KDO 8-P synthase)
VTPLTLGDITIGGGSPFVLIAGPCVIESESHAMELAGRLADIASRSRVPFIFKASFDKANRTSGRSFRGPGIDEGLRVLAQIKSRHHVPILTDIHEPAHAAAAAGVADVLQIPAFLCRQTDLLVAAAKTGRLVNI